MREPWSLADDGTLAEHRVLICDRDAKWTHAVRDQLAASGVRVVQTPYRAPNANAHAERFVRSIKDECLNRLIPLGDRHFRRAVAEFVSHYHHERPHQGCGNAILAPRRTGAAEGRVRRYPRLGGLLNYYARAARRRGSVLGHYGVRRLTPPLVSLLANYAVPCRNPSVE